MHVRRSLHYKRFSACALAAAGLLTLVAAARNQFQLGSRAANLTMIALAILLALAAMAFAEREPIGELSATRGSRYLWLLLVMLLGLHGFVAFYTIRGGTPQIDCFTWQRDATATLLQGRDPYGTSHVNIFDGDASRRFYGPGMVANGRVLVGLTYPPATLLSALPGISWEMFATVMWRQFFSLRYWSLLYFRMSAVFCWRPSYCRCQPLTAWNTYAGLNHWCGCCYAPQFIPR